MKQILIIRHAKSSWAEIGQRDVDRPLNERGKRDAPEMARRIFKKSIVINAFISSPAKRALSTTQLMMDELKMKDDQLLIIPELYHAPPSVILSAINSASNEWNTIAIVCHNPGITIFANMIQSLSIDNVPTCGMLALKADVNAWQDVSENNMRFEFFDYPKNQD